MLKSSYDNSVSLQLLLVACGAENSSQNIPELNWDMNKINATDKLGLES